MQVGGYQRCSYEMAETPVGLGPAGTVWNTAALFLHTWHEQEMHFCGVKPLKSRSCHHSTAESSRSPPGPLARGLLEMQILRLHTAHSESETEGGATNLGFNSSPGDSDTGQV